MKSNGIEIKTNDKIVDNSPSSRGEGIVIQISESQKTLTTFHPRRGANKVKTWTFDQFENSHQNGLLEIKK